MLISQSFDVAQPVDSVWKFFDDIPLVAACIPGADLTNKVSEDEYHGDVTISAGPVKLEFAGVDLFAVHAHVLRTPNQPRGPHRPRRECARDRGSRRGRTRPW